MSVDKEKIMALAARIKANGNIDMNKFAGGGSTDDELIGPPVPTSVRVANAMKDVSDRYKIAKGDSLSKIAQKIYGDPMKYTLLADVNGITNPDVIYPGQEIVIPKKYDRPLKMSEIPTKNVVRVIDNYSPNYNYIVEGDKVYYSVKGRDYWVDISDNEKARKNLLNFLGDKYNFRGYEDDESKIRRRVNAGNFNYEEYRDSLNNVATGKAAVPENAKTQQSSIVPEYDPSFSPSIEDGLYAARDNVSFWIDPRKNNAVIDQNVPTPDLESLLATVPIEEEAEINDLEGFRSIYREEGLPGVIRTAKNGISRRLDKLFMNNEEVAAMEPPSADLGNSEYGLLPMSFTGDTLRYRPGVLPREYFIPESIDMTASQFGTRNRGDLTELDTEGAVITTFNAFKPYEESNVSDDRTYIGVDSSGNFKVGNGSEFGPGDKLTRTYANDVYDFAKDKNGNYKFQSDSKHHNANQNVAIVNVKDEKTGEIKESGALNILVGKNDTSGSTYGSITGGRVLVKVGNEIRLLSGSIQQIESEFNAMKQRQHTDHGTFYTLDNGSFNKALRTYDKKLTKGDLSNYDKKNTSGGNFLYLLPGNVPSKYPQDTVYSPNVRTEKSESYRKGHPLKNANKGVVLHYTAFPETNDMTAVTNHFMNPKSEASAHLLITPNGSRRVFADEDQVAFHAGYSSFNGVDDVNDFMHGIEFQASGPNVPLTKDQIDSAVEYLERYIRKYNIPLENIVSHEAVRDAWLNSHSEQEARRKGVQRKQDLSPMQMKQIIDALKERVYYKKADGGYLRNFYEGGGPNGEEESSKKRYNGSDLTLEDYKNIKRKEIIDAAVDKAVNRKYGIAPRIGDASCLYTVTDNFGNKYRVAGNQTFLADPGKYGFVVNGPIENLEVGDLYQFMDERYNPYHAVMVTGFDENGKPLVSYSSGNAPRYNPNDIYNKGTQEEARERYILKTSEEYQNSPYLKSKYGTYDDYFKSIMSEYPELYNEDYKVNKPLWHSQGITAHEIAGDSYAIGDDAYGDYEGAYETYRFVGTPEDNMIWENEFNSLQPSIVKLPKIDISVPTMLKSGGKIYIKPENRGKFTALKKRTGHSTSWFKAHGTPAQKKMATFALNAKKWKHAEGGSLEKAIDEGRIDIILAAINNIKNKKI